MNMYSSRPDSLLKRLRVILAVTVLVPLAALSAAGRDSVKLLTIGNSFSNDATAVLPQIVKAGDKTLLLGKASLGGCSFERHARHLKEAEAGDPKGKAYGGRSLPEILAAEPWDIVTIQQWSLLSFKPETFQPYADEIIAAVRKYAPTAEIVVHQTWAYREDHPIFYKNDGFTPAKMYEGLTSAYKNFADGKGFRVLPVGDAFNLARQTPRWTYTPDPGFDFNNPPAGQLPDQRTSLNTGWRWNKDRKTGEDKFGLDAIHSNTAGRYLGACVWYLQLFDADTLPAGYAPDTLSAEDAADLRAFALAAVQAERAREKAVAISK